MIRVGVGGWIFPEWRRNFYPKGLKHADELAFAASKLTAIEINATFYGTQAPGDFARWRDATPDGFVFTVKAHRAAVSPKYLAAGKIQIDAFLDSGPLDLGDKLGPILWQLPHNKKFDPPDVAAFCAMLPPQRRGLRLRHALEVRHATFLVPELVDIARKANVAIVFADSDDYPMIADITSDFVYARLQRSVADQATGYAPADLDRFAKLARAWSGGGDPADVPHLGPRKAARKKRDVFAFVIAGAKQRNPAAAMALIERL